VSESTPVEVKFAHVFPYSRDHEISAEVQSSGSDFLGEVTIELRPLPGDNQRGRNDSNWAWRHGVHNKAAFVVSLGSNMAKVIVTITSHELSSVTVCCGMISLPTTIKIVRLASSPEDTCPVSIAVTRVSVR
jgi:hypothetical protein